MPPRGEYRRFLARMRRCPARRCGAVSCYQILGTNDLRAVLHVARADARTVLIETHTRLAGLVDHGVWRGWYPSVQDAKQALDTRR